MNPTSLTDLYSIFAIGNSLKRFSNPIISYAYYSNKRVNLLSGEEEDYSLTQLEARLNDLKIDQNFSFPVVFHLMYELGYLFVGDKEMINGDDLLALELIYQNVEDYKEDCSSSLELEEMSKPTFEEYREAFDVGYQQLLNGNCYQFNLTFPFHYRCQNGDLKSLVNHFWCKKLSAYGHGTFVPFLQKTFFSNSPECLFQMKRNKLGFKLWAMPIKGTLSFDGEFFGQKWKALQECEKNGAELDMITDMLRNDLSSIEEPSAKVIRRNCPLVVPSILHQFSLVSVDLSSEITLGKILKSIFPGGSITGAPKKRVMEILSRLEKRSRGFYCGSTVLLYGDILAASINIRSMEVDCLTNNLLYQAGGGITLKSHSMDEFNEMFLKTKQLLS